MADQKFFICEHCGNIIGMIKDMGVPVICCGEEMKQLVPNTMDASQEKHVPVIVSGASGLIVVEIGSTPHPMEANHYIEWIYLETEKGGQRKNLEVGKPARAVFALRDDKAIAAYAYCNIHGLWKASL